MAIEVADLSPAGGGDPIGYPPTPEEGKSYAYYYNNGAWAWSEVPAGAPPIDLFVDGWAAFPITDMEALIALGTNHAAVSMGPGTPTINGQAFEQSDGNAGDTAVPAGAGWSGTNWQIQRESEAPVPSGIGTATGRTEVTAFVDLPDPSFGTIVGLDVFCTESMRRNTYITISNLTIGNRYYVTHCYLTYPDSKTRATKIEQSDGGDPIVFGVDGVGAILEKGLKRYGFTAAATSISFQKFGPDGGGSYCNGLFCSDMGV